MNSTRRPILPLLIGLLGVALVSLPAAESLLFDGHWEYHEDHGNAFGERADGLQYGWTATQQAGDAEAVDAPSEKYDTYVAMPVGAEWEIALPAGVYRVLLVAGDPLTKDAHLHVEVEGRTALDRTVAGDPYWATGHIEVTVTDGRLTLQAGERARNAHLLYLQVYSPMYGHYPEAQEASLPLKINCGGPVVDDFKADQKWTPNADFGFVPIDESGDHRWKHDTEGLATYCAGRANDYFEVPASVTDIPGTELDAVHRTMLAQRGGKSNEAGPGFFYKIRLPPGTYDLTVLVTNMHQKRQGWNDYDLHVEDRVASISPGGLTDELYEAAAVTISDIAVTDGIMDIHPVFTGWTYGPGAIISGLIVESSDDGAQSKRRIEMRPPGSWTIEPADGTEDDREDATRFTELEPATDYTLQRLDGDG